jgi:hypothetical protein
MLNLDFIKTKQKEDEYKIYAKALLRVETKLRFNQHVDNDDMQHNRNY